LRTKIRLDYDIIVSSQSTVVNKYSNHETSTKLFWVKFKTLQLRKCGICSVGLLAVVYVLLGRAVTEYRWGGSRNIPFMRHKFLVLTVKKWLKLGYICGSYRKIKTGWSLFLDHSVYRNTAYLRNVIHDAMTLLTNFLRCICQKLWKFVGSKQTYCKRTVVNRLVALRKKSSSVAFALPDRGITNRAGGLPRCVASCQSSYTCKVTVVLL